MTAGGTEDEAAGSHLEVPAWLAPAVEGVAGIDGTDLSRFLPPEDGSGRDSAVLMALSLTDDGPAVLLTQRAADLRAHAGQVAFPGGAADPGDADAVATALRETEEEVGLRPDQVHVVATLPPLFIPVTGFVVTPVLAWFEPTDALGPRDPREVASVVLVPIAELVDPGRRFRVTHPSGWQGVGFEAGGLFVWGFTAGLLDRLLHLAGWEQPWDTTVYRPLPD